MQNKKMGFDPRAVANKILDVSDELNIALGNLALNKILFFAHSEILISHGHPLVSVPFEAWRYGPVLPSVYHEFKQHSDSPITTRATRLDRLTGKRVLARWKSDEDIDQEIIRMVGFYGRMKPGQLVDLSHEPGGPWDLVWNADNNYKYGMTITDDLILNKSTYSNSHKGAHRVH